MPDPPRILLVDDFVPGDEVFPLVMCCGRVRLARSTSGALEALARERFDVVIIDLSHSGARGLSIAGLARARGVAVPAVALAGTGGADARRAALEAGFDEVLTKPYRLETIAAAVARLAARG